MKFPSSLLVGITLLAGGASAFSAVAPPSATSSFVTVSKIGTAENGSAVDVAFSDDPSTTYRFHSLWLRDACRDEKHVVGGGVGERILTSTPVAGTCDLRGLAATGATITADGNDGTEVEISWNGSSSTAKSTYGSAFLRRYADVVAKPIEGERKPLPSKNNEMSWLKPYTGFPDAPSPSPDELKLWSNVEGEGADVEFPRFEHDDVLRDSSTNLELLKALTTTGVALVDNCPPPEDGAASTLIPFIDRAMGGLQKDPTRDQPNWQITKKVGATSISYDHDKRLNGHTDSSVPPHGIPGLVLSMNYVRGEGANTLVDGFAVAKKLRETDPEGFRILTEYGYDAERDFVGSRVDSEQDHYKSLVVQRKNRVFNVDGEGQLKQVVYNEVFRLPLTLPYDVFPKWYAAFSKFVDMAHNPIYERTVPMKAGTILLMNNWRVLHGRAGGMATADRKVVGGTILRESFFSRAHDLVKEVAGYDVPDVGL